MKHTVFHTFGIPIHVFFVFAIMIEVLKLLFKQRNNKQNTMIILAFIKVNTLAKMIKKLFFTFS